jgi:hypothetical protein
MQKNSIRRTVAGLIILAGLVLPGLVGAVQAASLQQTTAIVITVANSSLSGLPGQAVPYIFTIDNSTGTTDETVVLTTGASGLGIISAPPSVFVAAGATQIVTVAVNIAASTPPGSSEGIQVTFTPGKSILITTTVTAPPTAQPTTPAGTARPLVVVKGYYLDKDTIAVGDSFKLFLELNNDGALEANNLILSFLNESFLPQDTGGVVALGSLGSGVRKDIVQPFLVSAALAGQPIGTVPVKLTYTDANGGSYSEAFSITLQLRVYSGVVKPTATPTQAQVLRPQIVIAGYKTDVDPLQPGTQFSLDMDVTNLGNADARAVTMVLGGGVTPDVSGTPSPGGVSGGSGDLTNFAPMGSSNLVYLGDLNAGQLTKAITRLIVNVTANPGVYTLKISFVYTDPKGNRLVDDQVITMLLYQLPSVDVNFYRDPGMIFSGQPVVLPLQVVNMGRKQAVLGNMTVSAAGAEVTNNTTLVGPLDPGGFFTLDSSIIPPQAGDLDLLVVINYTDDFGQARTVEKTVKLTVQEGAPVIQPGGDGTIPGDGGIPAPVEETFWQKVVRFFKGLFGLDSAAPQNITPGLIETPSNTIPPSDNKIPVPLPSGGKGG